MGRALGPRERAPFPPPPLVHPRAPRPGGRTDAPDPMLMLVLAHEAGTLHHESLPIDDPALDAIYDAEIGPYFTELHCDPPCPTSLRGALAALRFVMGASEDLDTGHHRILNRVLTFLERNGA